MLLTEKMTQPLKLLPLILYFFLCFNIPPMFFIEVLSVMNLSRCNIDLSSDTFLHQKDMAIIKNYGYALMILSMEFTIIIVSLPKKKRFITNLLHYLGLLEF
ncbi:hypothetical protein BpHYR1_032676 [Brachionus plicatilis]|uniref:Uncharacterized protein n=1 Tax=Brachionus plicatilis TaxID=10195 RepID=A0A3M7PS93_BRAPC|nr:hypothetical protein BpHYR1_032676 [Brachionus plicatilis]